VVSSGALNLCASMACGEHGDARRAIDLLRVAAEIAERNQTKPITDEHVRMASQKIEEKKIELQKLKELYKQPEKIPDEIKISLAKKIEEKKIELKKLYQNPKQSIDIKKIQQWGALQLVKVFLGVPVIPGK